jgi:hypothetical protein
MRRRLPDLPAILQVYAVIAVMLSGWTIAAFLWKLSAWMLLLNLGEIITIFSYAMAANFLESLLLLSVLLAACVLLPARFLRDDFVVRGVVLASGSLAALMVFIGSLRWSGIQSGFALYIAPVLVLVVTVLALAFAYRWRSTIFSLADRLTVFLFILLPLFVLSSMYVILRNVS